MGVCAFFKLFYLQGKQLSKLTFQDIFLGGRRRYGVKWRMSQRIGSNEQELVMGLLGKKMMNRSKTNYFSFM